MKTKRCTKCGEEKSLDEFYSDARASDGRRSMCKVCVDAAHREWLRKNREHYNAYRREYDRKLRKKLPDRFVTLDEIERYPGEACYLAKARKLLKGEVVDPHCEV